ncbi:flagellar biosynthesis protein FlhG [Hydrogenispora ethanolica]|uniref:Flagellar biosynthesis protein FlhG n=1 Tax=Hydrogenispora ethanolica TaxID=1082276 RepID=A0A4R1RK59_HYDET|nr:MinD/ParA family protein [Hydrogenispora ethanolica]TCL66563.1 flagellar biosynthesis protein FlhG [Hydrogenispora ethanolica]
MADQAQRLREIMQQNRAPFRPSRVIAIASGKGGVGKTCIAVNLGITLSKLGKRVVLVDADLGMANVDVLMGVIPRYNAGNVIFDGKKISDALVDGPYGLKLFAGASGLNELADLDDMHLDRFLKNLNEIENYADIMLIDTGAGISKSVLKFVLSADEAIIVTTPDPTAITDAYGIIKVIVGYEPRLPIRVVVNMVQSMNEGAQVIQRLSTVAEKFLAARLTKLGFLPRDPVVAKAVKDQIPFVLSHPQAPISNSFAQIAERLVGKEVTGYQGPVEQPSFFERFFKHFRRV